MTDMIPPRLRVNISLVYDPTDENHRDALSDIASRLHLFAEVDFDIRETTGNG